LSVSPELIEQTKKMWWETAGLILTDEEAVKLIKGVVITGEELEAIHERTTESLVEAGIEPSYAEYLATTKKGSEILTKAIREVSPVRPVEAPETSEEVVAETVSRLPETQTIIKFVEVQKVLEKPVEKPPVEKPVVQPNLISLFFLALMAAMVMRE